MAAHGEDGDEEDEWRFSLSDLEDGDADDGDDESEAGSGSGVAGSFSPSETIEPGEIDPENALFVVVGILIGLVVVGLYATALL